jgi:photosystem II stability/assembly factor-like uncharacterized protein
METYNHVLNGGDMNKRTFQAICWAMVLSFFLVGPLLADEAQGSASTEDLNILQWRHIGPWTFSGRITDFAVPKGQSQVYYVATASGGVWKTADGGIHFEPIFDKYGNMSIGNIEVAPSDPNIVYLGTGEAMHARSSAHGNGMWKSTDAGQTWKFIGLKESFFIPKIAIDDKNPDIVYVAVEGKLYDNEMDCQRGLYKTTDGGETWTQVLDLKDRGVGDFVIDPSNSDIVIAGAYKTYRRAWTFIDRQEGNHFYKSADGGTTWKKLTVGLPMDIKSGWNGITIYPKDPNILYIRYDEEVNVGLSERDGAALFRDGSMFKDGYYFNKFKSFRINPAIQKLVKFEPVSAENERKLAEELNKIVRDEDFPEKIGIDFQTFNAKAREVYRRNKEIIASVDEIERTLKREEEWKDLPKKINLFILAALFTDSTGIEITEQAVSVSDPDKVQVSPRFAELVAFDPDKVKDGKDLAERAGELVEDPKMAENLGINISRFVQAAKEEFKDEEDALAKAEAIEKQIPEIEQTLGRYQTINRYILQILYADALAIMEPVKKYGVIYRSEDQGETWKRMTEYKLVGGSDVVNQIEAGYAGRMEVDPNDDKMLYAVEVRNKVSEDAGITFKNVEWTGQHKSHVDTRGIWIDPLNSDHILNANDGGVSETWDGGKHWSQKETISAQQFYTISVDNQLPYNVMGGTQDNGCWIGPSQNRNSYGVFPADWTYLPSGDGFFVERNWWNPEFIYFESQFGNSRRMNFKTGEMTRLTQRNTAEERAEGKPRQRYQWSSPIVLSPHNPGIVYICSQHVFMSRTRGEEGTWVTISPDLSKNNKDRIAQSELTNLQYATITTFAESPVNPGVYWAGTDDGNLQLSRDGGKTWENITARFYDGNGKPKKGVAGIRIPFDRWVTKVEASAHDLETCYVTFSGYRTHNEDNSYIFVSRDFGQTWEDLSGGMMNPVNDIEEDPHNSDVLYLATDYGVFVTVDKGKNWVEMSSSAPDVLIMGLAIQERERDLAIGTYGRGFYIADIYPLKEFKADVFEKDAHLFDIQRVIKWRMLERRGPQYGEFARTTNPSNQAKIYYYLKGNVKKVEIVIQDLEGNEIQKLTGIGSKGLHLNTWNLRRSAPQAQADQRRARPGGEVDAGVYKIILIADGEEIQTKKMEIFDDPILNRN